MVAVVNDSFGTAVPHRRVLDYDGSDQENPGATPRFVVGGRSDPEGSAADTTTGLSSLGLLRRARGGDAQALNRLYLRYLPLLRRWATGRLPAWARDTLDTEDLVQETLARTITHLREFEPRRERGLHLYLREALRNRIRDELRRKRRHPGERVDLDDRVASDDPSPLEQAIAEETWERYEQALARLSEDERSMLVARIDFGLSYREIADVAGKPTDDAARMAVSRALVKIASAMGRDE